MAVGLSAAIANDVLDAIAKNDALTTLPIAALWVKLHVGDPGAAGASNAAGNTTRHQATFGSAASGGSTANTVAIDWSTGEVTTPEDYTHWSGWTASTAGTFLCSGLVTANAVLAGDQFSVPIGSLTLTLNIAS